MQPSPRPATQGRVLRTFHRAPGATPNPKTHGREGRTRLPARSMVVEAAAFSAAPKRKYRNIEIGACTIKGGQLNDMVSKEALNTSPFSTIPSMPQRRTRQASSAVQSLQGLQKPHLWAYGCQTKTPRPRRRRSCPRRPIVPPSRGSSRFSRSGVKGDVSHEPNSQFSRHHQQRRFRSDPRPGLASPVVALAGSGTPAATAVVCWGARADSTVAAASGRRPPAESDVVLRAGDAGHRVKR